MQPTKYPCVVAQHTAKCCLFVLETLWLTWSFEWLLLPCIFERCPYPWGKLRELLIFKIGNVISKECKSLYGIMKYIWNHHKYKGPSALIPLSRNKEREFRAIIWFPNLELKQYLPFGYSGLIHVRCEERGFLTFPWKAVDHTVYLKRIL